MRNPSAILSRIGFYFLLLFAFAVSIFPGIALILAVAIITVWLAQITIFRQLSFVSTPLFYPITGLFSLSLILWLLSEAFDSPNPTIWTGLFSLFYLVTLNFVQSDDRRKMIIWTFLSGVILSLVVDILMKVDSGTPLDLNSRIFSHNHPLLFMIAFSLAIAYFGESNRYREKIFFGLIFIPIIIGIVASDSPIAIIMTVVAIVVALVKDRSVLILIALAVVAVILGAGGIRDDMSRLLNSGKLIAAVEKPLTAASNNHFILSDAKFFGALDSVAETEENSEESEPYFISLVKRSGPPVFLLFLWTIYELARRDLTMFKKLSLREEKVYHLATLVAVSIFVLAGFYSSVFGDKSAILGLWMILGMAEV